MNCSALRQSITPDHHLADLHFLIKTKAQREGSHAVDYTARRFFDHFERKTVQEITLARIATLENYLARILARLGLFILTGVATALIHNFLALALLPIFFLLLAAKWKLVKKAWITDRRLRTTLSSLQTTREQRRTAFVNAILNQSPSIVEGTLA
jgi:hypothetical protein